MEEVKSIPIPGKSRNLLHKGADDLSPVDNENPYGITFRPPVFWQQGQTPSVAALEKNIINDIELDGDEKKINVPVEETGKENVVYVQIEQTVEDSNVTYVTSDDYKNDHNYESSVKMMEAGGQGVKKRKHDL